MFGRVPGFLVDVLFYAVLKDSALGNYDKYVPSLTDTLKEAMMISQDHASKEHRKHA